jgi:hypothetical protein
MALYVMPWSLIAEVQVTAIVAILVQGFFVFRVWRLSHKNIFLTVLVVSTINNRLKLFFYSRTLTSSRCAFFPPS